MAMEEKNKIGVYICHCGSNISDYVDVEKVREEVAKIKHVSISKTTMFACADATQNEIVQDIQENDLDAIVVASCSPKLHLDTFKNVAERAGLNPYNYVQINIREQCSWAHSDKPVQATEKALQLVKSGIARVGYSEALVKTKISAENVVVVVGAGVSGMRSAIELADLGSYVYLIEREYFVGGRVSQWGELFTTNETGKEIISRLYHKLMEYKNITLFTGAEIISNTGTVGNFDIQVKIRPRYIKPGCKLDPEKLQKVIDACPVEVPDVFNFNLTTCKAIYKNFESEFPEIPAIDPESCTKCGECEKLCDDIDLGQQDEFVNIKAGAIIINTGYDPYEPKTGEFGYKEIENVITLPQFKRLIELNSKELIYKNKRIKNIGYIYCVGSRQKDGENKYCSRYCCTSTIYTSIVAKNKYKDIHNYHFDKSIRTYGKLELLYREASENGDVFLQFWDEDPPVVSRNGNGTVISIKDMLSSGKEIDVDCDLVVLVTGMVPRQDNKIADILKAPIGRDKFFNEIHPKLRPVETVIDGVLISGACQGPKNISESLKSSLSAASKANSLVKKGEIELKPTIAFIDKNACVWCDECVKACPFDAIIKVQSNGKDVAEIIEAKCKGGGMCLPVCPENAINLKGYTDNEMEAMITALAD